MNKSAFSLIRLIALTLLIVMSLSLISCDTVNSILGGESSQQQGSTDETPNTETPDDEDNKEPENDHTHVFIDGICECGECDLNYEPPHEHNFVDGVCRCGETDPNYVPPHEHNFVDGKCECGESEPGQDGEHTHEYVDGKCECGEIKIITIAEAIAICQANPNGTTERYYIRATVKTISNPAYGEMYIVDETGELYVYGTYSSDGALAFPDIAETPVKGDEVLLHCILSQYKGENQVKNARLIEFTHVEVEFDPTNYTEMSIADARDADEDTLVIINGVVAQITYANGKIPSGVIVVDGTSSIYVYDGDIAGQAKIGNTIKVAGRKTYWVLGTEQSNAEKFNYKGACQLDTATLLSNDNGTSDFDKSWIEETTVKEIMDTPVTENITNKIFKVTALVKKAPGNGFVNYYIDDLDGATGSYVYTQCNGSDFGWLDQFDGKFCTVYFVAINAKSTATGCTWRFLPISVIDEGYTFDVNDAAEYAVKYHGVGQFLGSYTGDPAAELVTSISSELLGFEGATLSYSSSDESVVYFTTDENGAVTFHCGNGGKAIVTVTATHGENTYSETVEISVEANEEIEYITVADAIATAKDTDVVVKGIVGPSLVNKVGFYLFGEDGSMIAVIVNNADDMKTIAIGNEIIISGMRERYIKDDSYTSYGQDAIVSGVIVANYYGEHAYSTEKFITDKTLADIKALNITESHSTEVYVVKVTVEVVETPYYTNLKIMDGNVELQLYCSSASQYNWLKAYAGQEITIEVAPCNWNDKNDNYRGCVLAVVNEDGTKVLNTLNWNN